MEQAIRKKEDHFRGLFNTARGVICVLDGLYPAGNVPSLHHAP
jgi:hypothetical protein